MKKPNRWTRWRMRREGRKFAFYKGGEVLDLRTNRFVVTGSVEMERLRYLGIEYEAAALKPQAENVIAAWLVDERRSARRAALQAEAVMGWCEAIFPKRVAIARADARNPK